MNKLNNKILLAIIIILIIALAIMTNLFFVYKHTHEKTFNELIKVETAIENAGLALESESENDPLIIVNSTSPIERTED